MAVYAPFSAGQPLTADQLNTLIVQEVMEWTNLSSLGTFSSPFSAASYTPRMRKLLVAGTPVWEFEGAIAAASWTANTTQTAFTFTSSSNKPGHELGSQVYATGSSNYGVRLGITVAGLLTLGAPTAAGTGVTSVIFNGLTFTNPMA